jgi:hypothetical protein
MTKNCLRVVLVMLLTLSVAGVAEAGTVSGVVRNATKGSVAAGVDVILIQLQGGMETVANTKTDAQGRYKLEHASIGLQPMLVRVNYRGVNFHQALPPGRNIADVEVFEQTTNASAMQVASRVIVLQPDGPQLVVGEEYAVENHSTPPMAHYKSDGNFEFQLPEGGELKQVSAWGPAGMPVVQGTIDKAGRRQAIAFAFRPGKNGVRLSYQMPYATNQATLGTASPYAVGRVLVVVPPTLQVSGAGFQPAGTEQGWNIYARDSVAAGTPLDISVSGTAPPPSASGGQSQGRESGRREETVQVMPNRLDGLKWVLVGGFAALFFLGAVFLWLRPAGSANNHPEAPRSSNRKRGRSKQSEAATVSRSAREAETQANRSLEELKDTLFGLELRRQAGTISEEDYARERGRAEGKLRELVKG